jgi:hypothetical protein
MADEQIGNVAIRVGVGEADERPRGFHPELRCCPLPAHPPIQLLGRSWQVESLEDAKEIRGATRGHSVFVVHVDVRQVSVPAGSP